MSIIRRSDKESCGGVYIYEMGYGGFHCQICPLHADGSDTFMRSRIGVALHMLRHWWAGHLTAPTVALRAFQCR